MNMTLSDLTSRMASLTSIERTKTADQLRADANGGELADILDRAEANIKTLRNICSELEAKLNQ